MCNIVEYRAKIEERWFVSLRSFDCLFMPTLACKTGEKACGVSVSIKATGSKALSSLEVLES